MEKNSDHSLCFLINKCVQTVILFGSMPLFFFFFQLATLHLECCLLTQLVCPQNPLKSNSMWTRPRVLAFCLSPLLSSLIFYFICKLCIFHCEEEKGVCWCVWGDNIYMTCCVVLLRGTVSRSVSHLLRFVVMSSYITCLRKGGGSSIYMKPQQ